MKLFISKVINTNLSLLLELENLKSECYYVQISSCVSILKGTLVLKTSYI